MNIRQAQHRLSSRNVRQAQHILASAGHPPGPFDGLWGRQTAAAVMSFQRAAGLRQTGQLDRDTIAALSSIPGLKVIYQGKARHVVDEIIMHCSATRPLWMSDRTFAERFAEIRRWHVKERGWRDIGYHWLIDRDGSILPGRAENVIGSHVMGQNSGTIGICLLGGHGSSERDRFSDNFTVAQDTAARWLIDDIKSRTTIKRVSGHNEYAAKACPGFQVAKWLAAA
ncbi:MULTISPECIES: peptidoglycan-binding protein [unclassified Yoonia]|uniref:peptidoglycan recognition protein family protein n=1 Tax=unclassified Yoonia TaxID=2629118 RepID=UPI002AFEB264|nr:MULTISPECIES: peptidoglycan-binding protein [unclassified Yoonia]